MTLEIKKLTYQIKQRTILKEISLIFQRGLLYGLLGPNGSGKSTLFKTVSRIWTPTSGELYWEGNNLSSLNRLEMSRTLSLVPQHPQCYFDCDVYYMVQMGRYPYGCRSSEGKSVIEKALHQVNAWHLRHQMLSQLSGGERQRVYIARALVTESPILLLDEPTSHLDLRHQLEIWKLLRSLAKEGKLIIAAIHDIEAAKRFCDQLVILNHGVCQGMGLYDEVMNSSVLQEVFGVSHLELSS